jgi:HEAT repeat protein
MTADEARAPRGGEDAAALVDLLRGGDRRSVGRVPEVVARVQANPPLFAALVDAMEHGDAVVRMRAADAAEKLTAAKPEWLHPHRDRLMALARTAAQQEVRWHLALMLPRLPLTATERAVLVDTFTRYLDDASSIVRTCAMQGLGDLAGDDHELRARVVPVLRACTERGTPAMRARGRKLLRRLEPE